VRVVIAGGGRIGTFVARELRHSGHAVTIVEIDPDRVAHATMNDEPPGVAWMAADACEVSELTRAEPEHADVVCALTGDDEDNLVISLLAKSQFGVPRVVARVNNPDNEWLFDEVWGVDVPVSTPHIITALADRTVSVAGLVRLLAADGTGTELVECTLTADSPAAGSALDQAGLPPRVAVIGVVRSGQIVIPTGDVILEAGDDVFVLARNADVPAVQQHLTGQP
jgi:trk system potassium uptake protein TrkA